LTFADDIIAEFDLDDISVTPSGKFRVAVKIKNKVTEFYYLIMFFQKKWEKVEIIP